MEIKVGSRVIAPWAKYGDYQDGIVKRIYTRKGVQVADVAWDELSNPDVYAGDSEGIELTELTLV